MLDRIDAATKLKGPIALLPGTPLRVTLMDGVSVSVSVPGRAKRPTWYGRNSRQPHVSDDKKYVATVNVFGSTDRRYFDDKPTVPDLIELAEFLAGRILTRDVMEE